MKKCFFIFGMFLMAAPANADLTHKISSSVQLQVDSAASQSQRIGSQYSVSGTNVTLDTAGGLGALTAGSAVGYTAGDYSITTTGSPFSFTEAFLEGDATPTATTVTAGVTPTLPMLGNTTTTAGGVAGSLAGTITSAGIVSLTAGGAGTSATGQYISEITVR
eukprot:GHVR01104457.1.p1 GENE.GHVR01104457.1~~GHVR01104457.1.p1  ORF type:complete len:163 (-),score=12.73 GHVR01104457.1:229-717(-)